VIVVRQTQAAIMTMIGKERVATAVTLTLVFQMMMMSCLREVPLVASLDNIVARDDSEADSDPISFLWETTVAAATDNDAADDAISSAIRPEVLGCSARKRRNKQSLQKQQQQQQERSFKDLRLEFLQNREATSNEN